MVQLSLNPPDTISKTAIYIDDRQIAENTEEPFNQFILKMADIGPGEHVIRVEATDENGETVIEKRDLKIPTPEPYPTSAVSQPSTPEKSTSPSSPLVLLLVGGGVGLLILIIVIGLVIIRRKQSNPIMPAPTAESTDFLSADNVHDIPPAVDPYQTVDEGDTGLPGGSMFHRPQMPLARLVVIDGVNVLKGDTFPIMKMRTVLGRNAGGSMPDIDIPDKPVSRSHAEIIFNGQYFTIQDTGSTFGTYVNGKNIGRNAVILQNQSVIGLGTRTKLRFEIIPSHPQAYDDPDRTVDGNFDDPFKTTDMP